MRLLTAGEVCDVLSTRTRRFPYQTLNTWVRNGIIRPVLAAQGTGRHRVFAIVDVLAVAMGRGLRASGFTLKAAGAVTETLMNFTEEQLLDAFAEDRRFLMVAAETVQRKLVHREEIVHQSYVDIEAGREIGLLPIALDVQRLYENICRRIDKLPSQSGAQQSAKHRKKRTAQQPRAKRKPSRRKVTT